MRACILGLAMTAIAVCSPAFAAAADPTAQSIADTLRDSGKLVDYSLSVKFQDGSAQLSGRVANDEQRDLAIQLAESLPGVERVFDDLEVRATQDDSDVIVDSDVTPAAGREIRHENLPHPMRGFRGPAGKPDVAAARPMPMSSARSHGDPGDPLQQGQRANYGGESDSRRFAAEPPKPTVRRTSATNLSGRNAPAPKPIQLASVPAEQTGFGHHRGGPAYTPAMGGAAPCPANDGPYMPNHAWPSYATSPNYAAVSYPQQYSATAWPFIGPFYPYPQVPLGWRKVTLEWDDGWWFLDFRDKHRHH